jgi:hypothetical protein
MDCMMRFGGLSGIRLVRGWWAKDGLWSLDPEISR